jgi:hypothetical protein
MPSPLVLSELIVGPIAAVSPGFRGTMRQSGHDAVWVRITGELDIATAPAPMDLDLAGLALL